MKENIARKLSRHGCLRHVQLFITCFSPLKELGAHRKVDCDCAEWIMTENDQKWKLKGIQGKPLPIRQETEAGSPSQTRFCWSTGQFFHWGREISCICCIVEAFMFGVNSVVNPTIDNPTTSHYLAFSLLTIWEILGVVLHPNRAIPNN